MKDVYKYYSSEINAKKNQLKIQKLNKIILNYFSS